MQELTELKELVSEIKNVDIDIIDSLTIENSRIFFINFLDIIDKFIKDIPQYLIDVVEELKTRNDLQDNTSFYNKEKPIKFDLIELVKMINDILSKLNYLKNNKTISDIEYNSMLINNYIIDLCNIITCSIINKDSLLENLTDENKDFILQPNIENNQHIDKVDALPIVQHSLNLSQLYNYPEFLVEDFYIISKEDIAEISKKLIQHKKMLKIVEKLTKVIDEIQTVDTF